MKIFHTADWHLGQAFCGFDRDFEHTCFLKWLLRELKQHRPDALIIAGDIFDSINPSAVSQKRYYNFLANAHAALPKLQTVITAGNHDAAARLEAPGELLGSLNIRVVGTVGRNEQGEIELDKFIIPLVDEQAEVRTIILAVPFLRHSDVPYVANAVDPYLDGIREFYRQVTHAARMKKTQQYPDAVLIAMGHCHLAGGDESRDSERRVVVGCAEAVSAEMFDDDIAYVALGHLHKAQQFQSGRVRYSGSPIPLSFAEANYKHRLYCLTIDDQQRVSVDDHFIPRATELLKIPSTGAATLTELIPQLEALTLDTTLSPEQQPFLEVRILEDGPDPTRRKRIEDALQSKPVRLASIKVDSAVKANGEQPADEMFDIGDLQSIDGEEILTEAHREKYRTDPDESLVKAFREIVQQELSTE